MVGDGSSHDRTYANGDSKYTDHDAHEHGPAFEFYDITNDGKSSLEYTSCTETGDCSSDDESFGVRRRSTDGGSHCHSSALSHSHLIK